MKVVRCSCGPTRMGIGGEGDISSRIRHPAQIQSPIGGAWEGRSNRIEKLALHLKNPHHKIKPVDGSSGGISNQYP